MMKTCSKCAETKELIEFYKHRFTKDGLQPYCKTCVKEHRKQYYQENRGEVLEYQKQYYQENRDKALEYQKQYAQENRDKVLEHKKQYYQSFDGRFNHIKQRAKQRKIPFELTKEQAKQFWKKPCHYCGVGTGLNLDRKNSSGAYQISNIVSCCPDCNAKKGITPYEDFIKSLDNSSKERAKSSPKRFSKRTC